MRNRKWWFFISIVFLVLVVGMLITLEDSIEIEQKNVVEYLPLISVVELKPQDNRGRIQTYGVVKPRWNVALKARVSGNIIELSNNVLVGQSIDKGDQLIRLEDSAYLVAIREAEHSVSSAQIDLTRQRFKAARASKDWKEIGITTPPTALALNKPQLDLAEKSLKVAQSRLIAAKRRLTYTSISSPFSGIVVKRNISIGQSVSEGDELLQIMDNLHLDIAVSLSKQQLAMLDENWQNQVVSIRNLSGIEIANARVKHGGGFLDQKTRQHKLFLEVLNGPDNHVLPGDYVQVILVGKVTRASIAVPQSALTRDGFIWYVDDKNRLRRFIADVIFYSDNLIIVETPSRKMLGRHSPSKWQIATTPLASFLAGNRVQVRFAGGS